jgi:Domain of unknown function (DUF4124)
MYLIQLNHSLAERCALRLITASTMVLMAVSPAEAAVNKCTGADGKIVFSDTPCAAGQAAASVNVPAKAAAPASKTITEADLPKEGTAPANSRLQAFDMFCAESRERLAKRPDKASDNGPDSNFQLAKARSDKLCDPAGRLAAAEDDRQGQIITCNENRKSLASMKQKTLPPGYSYGSDITAMETYIAKNCPATLK